MVPPVQQPQPPPPQQSVQPKVAAPDTKPTLEKSVLFQIGGPKQTVAKSVPKQTVSAFQKAADEEINPMPLNTANMKKPVVNKAQTQDNAQRDRLRLARSNPLAVQPSTDTPPTTLAQTSTNPGQSSVSGAGSGAGADAGAAQGSSKICLLCKRQFASEEALLRHEQLSDLHKVQPLSASRLLMVIHWFFD
eukprot:TRINITY_DN10787_c0_g1_i1.p1 TRINITY_DN10787_c0_g1~~TRINITY_DN10787_c0_g1_i1.p1  ORF type:complete len:191 (+),score=14.65 TRINITY_DN10787_c0_g1_i1:371-943(+)